MNWTRWVAAAAIALAGLAWYRTLPPPTVSLGVPGWATRHVRGAFHVHTRRSDGTGTSVDVARAARRAGLQFVVITDHGDGTRQADTPAYVDGVLLIDAVEISTDHGHLVALSLPAAPYPLGGEARDVLDDVRRTGGFAVAAHPASPRDTLRWTEWDLPIDGIEWLNGDSEWRDEPWLRLLYAVASYPVRREETLASLLDRPDALLGRWDAIAATRPVVALAGSDAHARLGVGGDPYGSAASLRVPSYERVFRSFSVTLADVTFGGDAPTDAAAVINAIRRGHVYSSVDGLAEPAALSFAAETEGARAEAGDRLTPRGPVTFLVRSNAPAGAQIALLEGGSVRATADGSALEYSSERAGAYRVEIRLPDAPGSPPVPWVISNPIYVGLPPIAPAQPAVSPVPTASALLYADGPAVGWHIEQSPRSVGALDVAATVDGTQLLLRYGLGGTRSESPFVALSVAVNDVGRFDRLQFTARAARPTRISVQLRAADGARWRRSIYLDETPQIVTVPFDELRPVGTAPGAPTLETVRHVLFVVDTVNATLDASGQIWLDQVRLAR